MRFQFLRGHGLGPASLKARAIGALTEKRIDRTRLKRFIAEMGSRPLLSLPLEPPRSIAVVVPCFGHAAYLAKTIESVESQTRLPDEVIFVDDCSPDGSGEIVTAFIAGPRWPPGCRGRLLTNERNIGQSASLNAGIAAATADLVMVLNDDDYLMHDAVASVLGYFRDHRDVALVGANHISFAGGDVLEAAPKLSTDYAAPGLPLEIRRPADALRYRRADDLRMTHSGMCFVRAAWEAVGGYRADIRERILPYSDRDFQIRVNALWPVGLALHTPLAFWRNDSSIDKRLNS